MKLAYLRWVGPAIISILLSGPALAAASLPTAARAAATAPAGPVQGSGSAPVAPAAATEASSYAQREQQSQALERFRGGMAIYVGGSVVLLLVILLVALYLV